MLSKAIKAFLFLALYSLIYGIVVFIIRMPDVLTAFGGFLDCLPAFVTNFVVYLVLKDIEGQFTMLSIYMRNDIQPLKEKLTKQEKEIKTLEKELKEIKKQLNNG